MDLLDLIARALVMVMERVDRLRGRSISDGELAVRLGISRKTLARCIRADPGVLSCCVVMPVARPGKAPIRRWRAWEVEARWSGSKRRGLRPARGPLLETEAP